MCPVQPGRKNHTHFLNNGNIIEGLECRNHMKRIPTPSSKSVPWLIYSTKATLEDETALDSELTPAEPEMVVLLYIMQFPMELIATMVWPLVEMNLKGSRTDLWSIGPSLTNMKTKQDSFLGSSADSGEMLSLDIIVALCCLNKQLLEIICFF